MQSTADNVQLVRTFLEFKAREGKSRRTIQTYALKLGSLLEQIDPIGLGAIGVEDLERWLDRPRRKKCGGRQGALATIRNESAVLRSAYKFWSARGLVPRNTAALLGNVDRPRRQPKPADQAIVAALLANEGLPLIERFIYEAMHHLGLRREEVCRLRPSAFDVSSGQVTIDGKGAKQRVLEYVDLVAWQRSRGYAVGDFQSTVDEVLTERSGRSAIDREGRVVECFIVPWGERSRSAFAPMSDPQEVNKRLNRRLSELGLAAGSVTPHQFRHAFATWMLRGGMDVVLVSSLMGHSSVAVTQDYIDLGSTPVRELLRRELLVVQRSLDHSLSGSRQ